MQKLFSKNHTWRSLLLGSVIGLSGLTANAPAQADGTCEECFTAQFWETPERGSDYPEMKVAAFPGNRKSFGVALQGGGNRAAPAALGQLRALHDLGWMKHVRYITAISGGSWAAIPYTYLKEKCTAGGVVHCDQDTFLGNYYSPGQLGQMLPRVISDAKKRRAKIQSIPGFEPGSMLGAIGQATVARKMFKAWETGRFDEAYAETLGEIYLKPFGLGRMKRNDPDSLFTWRRADRDRVALSRKNRTATEIHIVERDRPYLIVGGTLLTQRIAVSSDQKFRIEMTPLYTGMPMREEPYEDRVAVGGGFVESHGYDYVTHSVKPMGQTVELALKLPQFGGRIDDNRLNFSLSNMAAVSGAAPVETFVNLPVVQGLLSNLGFPEHYAPVNQEVGDKIKLFAKKGTNYQKEWAHGDGGHEDNLGLAPLLARQVENIIVFANSFSPLNPDQVAQCRTAVDALITATGSVRFSLKDRKACERMIGSDLPTFFVKTKSQIHNVGLTMQKNNAKGLSDRLRGFDDLATLGVDLSQNRNVSCEKYNYDPEANGSHGIAYSPTICVIFMGLETTWSATILKNAHPDHYEGIMKALEINADGTSTVHQRKPSGYKSSGFPHLGTFFDQRFHIIDTEAPRLFALSNLTGWKLREEDTVQRIKAAFSKNGLKLD